MAHFLRGKQAGIQSDLSGSLSPESFLIDEVARYGINSRISAIAYDPVQSLLAAGTSETQFGSGEIYVFGQERVSAVFSLPRKASTSILQFCGDKLLAVAKNELYVFSLDERKLVTSYAPPGHATCVLTDPALDYAFIGLQNGELVTYDLDRHMVAPFKVSNLWKERNSRARFLPIVSLAFHPKDIGTLLIGYSDGAVIFSIKQNVPVKYFQYEVPKGAPGGDSDPSSARETRWPKVVKALWHPTATFVLTAHEDSSLVFWDPKDGRVVMARTIQAIDVNKPGEVASTSGSTPGTFSLKAPIFEIAWCCKENPDDTGLLIAGGTPTTEMTKGLTFIDLGITPNYQTSSWQVLSGHFSSLKRQDGLVGERREHKDHPFLSEEQQQKKALKRFETRDIAIVAHADGLIRLWDIGHDDQIENPTVLQVDLARAVGRYDKIEATQMSFSGAAGELSVGLQSGELVVFKWGRNENAGRDVPLGENNGPDQITSISHRGDPGLKEGLLPLALLDQSQGPITVLKHSDVGFICVGYKSGSIAFLDLRGPAVIYSANLTDFAAKQSRRSSWKSHSSMEKGADWPTCAEFGVLRIEDDSYSSISCFVGTNNGHLATFKILPSSGATYTVSFVGSCSLDDRVLSICPINAETGAQTLATQEAVSDLRNGGKVNGVIVAVTPSGCHIFKPSTSKGAHKNWDDFMCDAASVVHSPGGCSLVGLFGDGKIRAYSIPALKEIGSISIGKILDTRRLGDARISPSGDILAWTGPSEMAMLHVWGVSSPLLRSADRLFNPEAIAPPRPAISNLQWISGTQFVSTADVDLLVGGPNRPPSKRMLEQMRLEEQERQRAEREGRLPRTNTSNSQGSQESYWAYMQRQMQERTENLNIMGDSMDRLGENSSGLADDVNKFVRNQKKKAVLGALGSKFGF
ncbi:TPA_exp: Uncharacterized protein A8136_4316 [Trichophyton benhamiae CBS 112371]|nr:TPA_exp: Uncharacterized protein A8136_4316 [Trichophyton benhamiae CBS 112371]